MLMIAYINWRATLISHSVPQPRIIYTLPTTISLGQRLRSHRSMKYISKRWMEIYLRPPDRFALLLNSKTIIELSFIALSP